MSKAGYIKKQHIYWNILCTWTSSGKKHAYLYIGMNKSLDGSIEDAKRDVLWSKHPSFKTKVVGIRFE